MDKKGFEMTPDERKEKRSAYQRAYREANREKVAARQRAWHEANREKQNSRSRMWHEANREKQNASFRARYEANREKEKARFRAWYEANREKENARHLAYRRSAIENVADSYVSKLIGLPRNIIPQHLIEAKRNQVLIYRCIQQLQTTLKERNEK